ncbi:MAG: filamentous hemagglutinin N-terminal domain-containing protein, partial [Burkholderiales bacterium]|nr:filamentous hemagglutinin N-terminal domain-containing protein [Burkholderiales bacterium]
MNRIYKLVWNPLHRLWVPVPEVTRRARAGSASTGRAGDLERRRGRSAPGPLAALAQALLAALACIAAPAQAQSAPHAALPLPTNALPQGGTVVQGQAGLALGGSAGAPLLSVNQSSPRAVIDWTSFNLGSAASITFNQPNAQSATLNRVAGMDPSLIFGHISAIGQVTLINPAGVYFSPSAVLDVGALTATTLQQSDADFMAGRADFAGGGAGSVVNQGRITSGLGGYVALLAPEVRNAGLIVARQGTVALASGRAIRLDFDPASRLASLTVTPSQIATLVENRQAVQAPDGLIILSATSVNALLGSVVNSGTLAANSVGAQGGRIVVEGDHITLAAGSSLQADGAAGGGEVSVGGAWEGAAGTYQAATLQMAAGASVQADATQAGAGGTVVLRGDVGRADGVTTVAGSISARGAGGGAGGRVETSGHSLAIAPAAQVQTGGGLWLLDPADVTISTGGDSGYTNLSNTDTPNSGVSTVTINTTTLQTALNAGNNVTVTTTNAGTAGTGSGNITVSNAISTTGSTAGGLTLDAAANITVNAAITLSGSAAALALNAGTTINVNAALGNAGSGGITLNAAGGAINVAGSLSATATGAPILVKASDSITLQPNQAITTHDGSVTLWSDSASADGTGHGYIDLGNNTTINTSADGATTTQASGGGNITLGGGNSSSGSVPTGPAMATSIDGNNQSAVILGTSTTGSGAMYSGGGNISISGQAVSGAGTSTGREGIITQGAQTFAAGNGTVTFNGTADGDHGIEFGQFSDAGTIITSSANAPAAIVINGVTTASNALGFQAGVWNTAVRNLIQATGSGGISITGSGTTGINLVGTAVLSASGAIDVTTSGSGGRLGLDNGAQGSSNTPPVIFGACAVATCPGSAVTASSAAVTLTSDQPFANAPGSVWTAAGLTSAIDTTGTLTVQPTSASFSGGFNWPISNLAVATGAGGIGGLVLGKPGNLSDMNLNAAQSINGPITVYGGNVNQNNGASLTTSAGNDIVIDASANYSDATNLVTPSLIPGGRFIVYSHDPAADWFGNQVNVSGNTAYWGQTWSTLAPAAVGAGSRYVFAIPTTVTATTTSASKTYGQFYNVSGNVGYSGMPLTSAASYGNVYNNSTVADLLPTLPTISSNGSAVTASVAGSPYPIDASGGTAISGITLAYANTGLLTVNPLALNVAGTTVASKTYNGNNTATLAGGSLQGVINGDTVTLNQAGTYASVNVGTGISVAASDTLGGAGAGNYTLTQPTGLSGSITPLALTVTGTTAATKVYDGNTSASLANGTLQGVLSGDTVTLTQAGAYASPNAGNNVAVNVSDSLGGASAGNYTLTQPLGVTGTITPLALTVTGTTASNKTYDASTTATLAGGTLQGVLGGDTVTLSQSGNFASANVGTGIAVTASDTLGGASAGNYTLTQPGGLSANITPLALTVSGTTVASKTYNGNNTATLAGGSLQGVLGGDAVTLNQAGTYASVNVGTGIAVTASDTLGGAGAGNYTLTQPTGLSGSITPLALTVTGTTVADKTYDATTAATLAGGVLQGVLGGDTVTLNQAGHFVTPNTGSGVAVTATDSLGGSSAGNYMLTQPSGLSASIAPRALTITGSTVATKTYDGSTAATLTGGSLQGAIPGDSVNLVQAGFYASPDVGNGIAVTATDSLSGASAGNYTYTQPGGLSGSITPLALTVVGTTVATRPYNGNTSATLAGGVLQGVVAGDPVTLTQLGDFASPNAGTTVSVIPRDSLGGSAAGNYTLTQPSGVTGTITPLTLTVTGTTVANKTYDGSTAATLTGGVLQGLLAGDSVTLDQAGHFVTPNAGSGVAVVATDSLGGSSAGNYAVTQPSGLSANVAPATLTVSASANTKTYDGTTAAAATPVIAGLQGSDTASAVEVYASKNVLGTGGSTLSPSGLTIGDGNGGANYLVVTRSASGTITPAPLVVSATPVSKIYAGGVGTNGATPLVSGLVPGDGVAAAGESYTDPNPGRGKTVVPGAIVITDAAGTDVTGNYAISDVAARDGSIVQPGDAVKNIAATIEPVWKGGGGHATAGASPHAIDPATPGYRCAAAPATASNSVTVARLRAPAAGVAGLIAVVVPAQTPRARGLDCDLPRAGEVQRVDLGLPGTAALAAVRALPAWLGFDGRALTFRPREVPAAALPMAFGFKGGDRS